MRLLALLICAQLLAAQPAFTPDPADLGRIRAGLSQLRSRLDSLPASDLKADVEVYAKAAGWNLRYPDEFFGPEYVKNALVSVEIGTKRASELLSGKPSWTNRKGHVARAYISTIDGSVQPYGLLIPESYRGSPARLDVWLHGRGAKLNEISFLADHDPDFPRTRQMAQIPPDYIQLDVFGRTNNAYRWSGETDVFEAIESVKKRYNIDPARVVLRGFSMGGAGAWHLGLHYPSRWAAAEAGAGFNETLRYAKQSSLNPVVEKLLTIYDAYRYALNAFNLPIVGYGGEKDPQRQASVNVREQLVNEGFRFSEGAFEWTTADLKALFLSGPATEHKWHPESKIQSEGFIRAALPLRPPEHIRFVTFTVRYPESHWIRIEGLEKHYERAEVDARNRTIRTKNVSRLAVTLPEGDLELDGQWIRPAPAHSTFEKYDGKWRIVKGMATGKRPGLQGPVDDAFTGSFVCVRPTGDPLNMFSHKLALERLDRFAREYAKWLRADPVIRDDTAISDTDIRNSHLILFGDPGSNRMIARILKHLPIVWKRKTLRLGGKDYDASAHLPVLITPNPLNPSRYVVLNSGHTFGEREFRGTNALLFPRLGDWGVIRVADGAVLDTGVFDENWR
jgi:hypothetical protein